MGVACGLCAWADFKPEADASPCYYPLPVILVVKDANGVDVARTMRPLVTRAERCAHFEASAEEAPRQ